MFIECTICSDGLKSTSKVSTTRCGHVFHKDCLLQWLSVSHTCPQCRQDCPPNSIFRIFFAASEIPTVQLPKGKTELPGSEQSTAMLVKPAENLSSKSISSVGESKLSPPCGEASATQQNPKPSAHPNIGSSHVVQTPSYPAWDGFKFSLKTQAAQGKFIKLKICDPDGNTLVFSVWNKAPISQSIFKRYGDDHRVKKDITKLRFLINGIPVNSIHSDGTSYTAVDLDLESGDTVNVFRTQGGTGCSKCAKYF